MTRTLTIENIERVICHRSFLKFLSHVSIEDPPTPAEPNRGSVSYQMWPHLLRLATLFTLHLLIILLKARQIGASWLVAAYVLWFAQGKSGAVIGLFSRGEYEATVLLGKVMIVHRLLPGWLQSPLAKPSTQQEMELVNGSRIHAFASTRDAGRSEAFSLVVCDESDYHEWEDANYAATKPTIDAGGQMIKVSTANKRKMLSLFKALYREAPDNGWVKAFVGWEARPGRDAAWYERVRANVPTSSELPPDLFMEQEYPATEEEALSPPRSIAYLDPDATQSMLDDCLEPRSLEKGGLVRYWRPPVVAAKYVGFGDVAWGEKGAYSCFVLMDWRTGDQMAEIYGRPTADENALAIKELTEKYNSAYFSVESNGEGIEVVKKLIALGCGSRMYHRKDDWREDVRHAGYWTDETTRRIMLGDLEEAVRTRRIVPRCREAVGEFMTFIRNEAGRPEAAQGAYDDHVMAWAGCVQMQGYARWGTISGKVGAVPWGW